MASRTGPPTTGGVASVVVEAASSPSAGASVEDRLAALEAVVFGDPTGGADQGSEAFIDS